MQTSPSTEAEFRTFDSDGVELAYMNVGEGAPVLLIHGFASNSMNTWATTGWVDALSGAGYRVIALDCRGHGNSEKLHDPNAYSMDLMADDARRLLDHLELDQAHVFGYSMGARVSLLLGAVERDRIQTVTMGAIGGNMRDRMLSRGHLESNRTRDGADRVLMKTLKSFQELARSSGSDFRALAACLRAARGPLSQELLENVLAPSLVVSGTKDVLSGSATDLASQIPGASAYEINGCDHDTMVTSPSFRKVVMDFLGSHSRTDNEVEPFALQCSAWANAPRPI